MVLANVRWAMLAGVVGLILVLGAGCCGGRSPLADRHAEAPVCLPDGFYPLKGHYDAGNDDDNYNGWPRYIVSAQDNMIMAYVPTQIIRMGGGAGPDQVPERSVVVSHFYMDLHEVSNLQFAKFWAKTGGGCTCSHPQGVSTKAVHSWPCKAQSHRTDAFKECWAPGVNDNHPVRNVNWWEAWAYSKWTRKVLPTEAQWEAAARGDDGRIYPWGNEAQIETNRYVANAATVRANYDGSEYPAPVLSYAGGVSPFGIYGLSGNVWEWTADWYDLARYAWPSDEDPPAAMARGPKAFGDSNYPNPGPKDVREARVGPVRGDQRAIRGGSYANPIEQCRADTRAGLDPYVHQNNVGFRTILPLPPETEESEQPATTESGNPPPVETTPEK